MRLSRLLPALPALLVTGVPALAAAHVHMTYPVVRTTQQKQSNCGVTGSTRGANVTVFPPGATIDVTWDETVNHPSHYRLSFDVDGDDDFIIPAAYDDFAGGPSVLVDDIADGAGGSYTQTITLPDVECDRCTLQLIQMMYDKEPYGDGDDIYFQCADITLQAGAPMPDPEPEPEGPDAGIGPDPEPDDPGAGPATGGCSSAGDTYAGFAVIQVILALWFLRRRRES